MTNEIVQIIVNSSGAAAVAVMAFFVFRDIVKIFTERINKITDKFNETISNYMIEANKSNERQTKQLSEMSDNLKCIYEWNRKLVYDHTCAQCKKKLKLVKPIVNGY